MKTHENEFNHLLRGGRLLQEFLVDMAAKIEAERLNYIRLYQSTLRCTTYRGFVDALNDGDDFIFMMMMILAMLEGESFYLQHLLEDQDT